MALIADQSPRDLDPRFKLFHELMRRKVREILLVSTLYDACILEEDGRLAERIINEYRGLNLSQPPRLTWVSTAEEAIASLDEHNYDLVITMPRLADMDPQSLAAAVKAWDPDLPVILLCHAAAEENYLSGPQQGPGVDKTYMWSGNTDLLLAIIKNVEDGWNVARDTEIAGVRVILLVEDSPVYTSALLPILYKEVVRQTQAVIQEGLNEEHRLLTMRARPKILVASTFEEATTLYERYQPYVLGVISDVRFPRAGRLDPEAGVSFLKRVKEERFDIPLLLISSEPGNKPKAEAIPASFIDKNSPTLLTEVRQFLVEQLGFGDFVFRLPDGREIARAANFKALEKILPTVPDESFYHHWSRNDFSRWLFARTEILLAARLRPATDDDFGGDVRKMRQFLLENIRQRRRRLQKGVIVDFDRDDFDPETEFLKIGGGSLGGKARGLVFTANLLARTPILEEKYPGVEIFIPPTLVISTEVFDRFVSENDLWELAKGNLPDEEVAARFVQGTFPEEIAADLRAYLFQVRYPLAVRSSALLEDARFRAYAGLYRTYMLPNDDPELEKRLSDLITAIKLVYASTYSQDPKTFARRVGHRTEDEKMAVMIQRLVGRRRGNYFYPDISGIAQSYNYYPVARMAPEDGIAVVALGLGRTVVRGGQALRFCPRHPEILPQFSTVEDILKNSQRSFYALRLGGLKCDLKADEECTLEKRSVLEAMEDEPVRRLSSIYLPEEHAIRDTTLSSGQRVLTFSRLLKQRDFPLPDILADVLELGEKGMGCPVEVEFSANMAAARGGKPEFACLQVRPMTAKAELMEVEITEEEVARAFCLSRQALGNGERCDLVDIVLVKPAVFQRGRTREIAREIGKINAMMAAAQRNYLLVGPGRWGSADPWLGIPVNWAEISNVGAIVEASLPELQAEPSQGSHFFLNITTLGIPYFTVETPTDRLDWQWLASLSPAFETRFTAHVRLEAPLVLKVDGRRFLGVIYAS